MPYVPYYDPTGWVDDPSTDTPISAAALNHIEQGIVDAGGDITSDPAWAAKGDLIMGTGDDAAAIKSIGSDDAVLVADSGQATGAAWQKVVNANVDAAAAIARSKLAAETRLVPVSLLAPIVSASAGNAYWTVGAQTNYDQGRWEMVKDVGSKIYGQVIVPSALSATGGSLILHIAANATSGVTRLSVATKAVGDGESVNPSFTAETAQDITVPATAYLRKDVTFALTDALAGGDLLLVQVYHEGAHANDTLAVNTLLLGATLSVSVA
jgi:hypothetical protein